jgi:hypothetical protein
MEYTNIYDSYFNNTLKVIIDYIDDNNLSVKKYHHNIYKSIQNILVSIYNKANLASIRKSINQFIKLGFINFHLNGYHKLSKKFLYEKDNDLKRDIFSKIVYSNASFNRSVTKNDNFRHIEFFIKTLSYSGPMNKKDIAAMISTYPSFFRKGYMTRKELKVQKKLLIKINSEIENIIKSIIVFKFFPN